MSFVKVPDYSSDEDMDVDKKGDARKGDGEGTASSSPRAGSSKEKGGGGDSGSRAKLEKKEKPQTKWNGDRGLVADRIVGATDATGELVFLIRWKNTSEADLVPATWANETWPQVVIKFYEEHVHFGQAMESDH